MIPARFRYLCPATLEGALRVLHDEPEARLLAGGQSLLTLLKTRAATAEVVVDLGGLDELRDVRRDDTSVRVGAMVTMAALGRHEDVRESAPMLAIVLRDIADVQVRNRGTLGGSIAYGDPSGDLAGAAIAAGASVRVVSLAGEREMPVADLYTGSFSTVLAADEMIAEVVIPRHDGARAVYHAIARRPADPTLAGVALVAWIDDDVFARVGIGLVGLADRPVAAVATAGALQGRSLTPDTLAAGCAALATEVAPLDSTAGPGDYRRAVAAVALERALRGAVDSRQLVAEVG